MAQLFQYSVSGLTLLLLAIFVMADLAFSQKHHPHRAVDDRIIGGKPVPPHSQPYMVDITAFNRTTRNSSTCGGSLISDQYVLTAAHCLADMDIVAWIRLGAHNKYKLEPTQKFVFAKDIVFVSHVDFTPQTFHHDIALIKVKTPINITTGLIEAIALPDDKDANKTYVNETVQAYGWGYTNEVTKTVPAELMGVNLTVIDHNVCSNLMKPYALYDYEICTGGRDSQGPVGTCSGDSGGPLVFNGTLIGITSRGPSNYCSLGEPSVYLSVGHHLKWIAEQMKIL